MNKTTNPLQRTGWIAKYSMEVRGILLQGTAFHHVNRLIEEGTVGNDNNFINVSSKIAVSH